MVIVGKMMVRGEGSMMRHKNIRCIGGKPMIYWSLKHALDAEIMDDIFVFTEDETVAQVTTSLGCQERPFTGKASSFRISPPHRDSTRCNSESTTKPRPYSGLESGLSTRISTGTRTTDAPPAGNGVAAVPDVTTRIST